MRITRCEEFEMAHVLDGYNGGCGSVHGHSYKIEVTVEGPKHQDNFGMVMDFKELKQAIQQFIADHKWAYNTLKTSGLEYEITEVIKKYDKRLQPFDFVTSAENMVSWYAEHIDKYIKEVLHYSDVDVVEVKLWETTNSYATWIKGALN